MGASPPPIVVFKQLNGSSRRESHVPSAGGESGKRNRQAEITWLRDDIRRSYGIAMRPWVSANLNYTFRLFFVPVKAAHMTIGPSEQPSLREHLDDTERYLAAVADKLAVCRELHVPTAGGASGNRNRQAEIDCPWNIRRSSGTAATEGQRRRPGKRPADGRRISAAGGLLCAYPRTLSGRDHVTDTSRDVARLAGAVAGLSAHPQAPASLAGVDT